MSAEGHQDSGHKISKKEYVAPSDIVKVLAPFVVSLIVWLGSKEVVQAIFNTNLRFTEKQLATSLLGETVISLFFGQLSQAEAGGGFFKLRRERSSLGWGVIAGNILAFVVWLTSMNTVDMFFKVPEANLPPELIPVIVSNINWLVNVPSTREAWTRSLLKTYASVRGAFLGKKL